jgi:hypothetical protein
MHVRSQKIRRVISILGAAAVAGALVTTVTSASATTSQAATTTAFALKGSIAGGITTVESDQTLTFVFTETNQSTAGAYQDLVMTKATNVSVAGISPCVLPGGVAVNSDGGPSCEPGFVKPGQHVSVVITTTVTGSVPGSAASAQVCLSNESTGATGPCKTVSAKIA